ncbi:hypothetical protein ABIB25_001440 [Nakamurella sp. UYEF19]|uniref:DUF4349 domain-containing protein n=1 Tax=Nakamurella sp. UYEF19 TaxID=1756392 RepID=UPI003391D4EE
MLRKDSKSWNAISTALARRRGRRVKLAAGAAAAGLLLAFAVGCTSGSTTAAAASSVSSAAGVPAAGFADAAGGSGAPSAAASAAPAPSQAGSGKSSSADGKLPDVGAGVEAADRQVIRTANLTLNVTVKSANQGAAEDQLLLQKAVDDAAIKVRSIPIGAGYVSAAQGKGTTQSITLRVPAGGYTTAMDVITGIAPVTSRQESTEDVTSQMIDISSRMQTMKASVDRVRTLLSKADKIGDVIAIESELSAREADLESLQRQQAGLVGQTSLSTITVVLIGSITGVKEALIPPPAVARSGFLGGLANGWDAVRKVVHAGLTVVGVLIPFLPVVAVVILGVLIWRRRVRRPVATPAAVAGDPRPLD